MLRVGYAACGVVLTTFVQVRRRNEAALLGTTPSDKQRLQRNGRFSTLWRWNAQAEKQKRGRVLMVVSKALQ